MSLERRNPIPPGVYWVDVPQHEQVGFDAWVTEHFANLQILRVRRFPGGAGPGRDWVLFEIFRPVPRWAESVKVGYPAIAPRGRDTVSEDVIEGEDAIDQSLRKAGFSSSGDLVRSVGVGVITSVLAGVLLWAITKPKV